ncbi:hypothetical protein [Flaviaesturariibacter aridisoli]|uniref:Uncharacterized protein n=1 Tax=Flaviaesturariibacter aridisoli TaxID=2545761 RepID=A0A4R4DVM9_9BACT|nr:hypothetical protein [Flaviaesturariibacter aridisoli]TCZ64582.1 hypothetical protein E0486_18165 [Flaviaesturariibacter aridisoli]
MINPKTVPFTLEELAKLTNWEITPSDVMPNIELNVPKSPGTSVKAPAVFPKAAIPELAATPVKDLKTPSKNKYLIPILLLGGLLIGAGVWLYLEKRAKPKDDKKLPSDDNDYDDPYLEVL